MPRQSYVHRRQSASRFAGILLGTAVSLAAFAEPTDISGAEELPRWSGPGLTPPVLVRCDLSPLPPIPGLSRDKPRHIDVIDPTSPEARRRHISPGAEIDDSVTPLAPEDHTVPGLVTPPQGLPFPPGEDVNDAEQRKAHAVDINNRLANCPVLRDRLVWRRPDNTNLPYAKWPAQWRTLLNDFFQQLVRGETHLATLCPQSSRALHQSGVYYTEKEARSIYLAHVAHALYLDAENKLPWKLYNEAPRQIDQILASANYFVPIKPSTNPASRYPAHIRPGHDYQEPFLAKHDLMFWCDPRTAYRAMRGLLASEGPHLQEDRVASTQEQTLANLTVWMRDWFSHGDFTSLLPVSQQMSNLNLLNRIKPQTGLGGFTGIRALSGCHGGAIILKQLAHGLNIPLLLTATGESGSPTWENFYTNHGSLCWRWGAPDARCIQSLDQLVAYANVEPDFPVTTTGHLMFAPAGRLNYFRSQWLTPAELSAWGLPVQLVNVLPGVGLGQGVDSPIEREYFEYGYVLGRWLPSDREQKEIDAGNHAGDNTYGSDLETSMRLHMQFLAGGWLVLTGTCRDENGELRSDILDQARLQHLGAWRTGLGQPVRYQWADLQKRGKDIATAYGNKNDPVNGWKIGCDRILQGRRNMLGKLNRFNTP